ncbi:MAG: hypothetical protein GY941_01715 [Planctomycetes bacterium]|nr:hypothetical protein [Planctomycetota bacterium]
MNKSELAEKERRAAVRELDIPGHGALVERLANDGHTTQGEAAQKVVKAMKSRAQAGRGRISVSTPEEKQAAIDEYSEIEFSQAMKSGELSESEKDDLKYTWNNSKATRDEFRDFDTFVAWNKSLKRAGNMKTALNQ